MSRIRITGIISIMSIIVLSLVSTAVWPGSAWGEADKPSVELEMTFLSAYISRGQELSRNSLVLRPSATGSYKGLKLNITGYLDTKPYSAGSATYSPNYLEMDITLSYIRKFGVLTAEAGYIYYILSRQQPGGANPADSQEVFLTLGLATVLAPTLTVYKEIAHYHQWYIVMGLSHVWKLSEITKLKLEATASYLKSEDETEFPRYDANAEPTAEKYNNFHDGTVSVSLPLALTKSLTITPLISYVFPLCADARYEMKGRGLQGTAVPADRSSSFFFGGLTFNFLF